MYYLNEVIIIREGELQVNERFDSGLEQNYYAIFDIEEVAKEIGDEIKEEFKLDQREIAYKEIENKIKKDFKDFLKSICNETKEYLDRTWE